MFLLPSSTMYLQVDIICFEALSACSAILFFAECFKTQKKIFRICLIIIAIISALVALIYRYGLGVRVIRSRYPRSKLREDFNYNIWSSLLKRYVSPRSGKININGLLKKKEKLEEFIAMLAVFGPESTPSLFSTKYDKIAYWINAYNAAVIFAILEYFPINSILDIRTGFCCCNSSDYYQYQSYNKLNKNQNKLNIKTKIYKTKNNNKKTNKKYYYYNKKRKIIIKPEYFKNNSISISFKMNKINNISNSKRINKMNKMNKKNASLRKYSSRCSLKKSYWFFEALRFEIDGSLYSLREIERDIICTQFNDARIFACLSRGCCGSPKLYNAAFQGHLLNEQLQNINRHLCSAIVKSKDLCILNDKQIIAISSIFKHFKSNYIKYAKKNGWIISNRHNSINNDNGALLGYIYHFANKEMKNNLSYPIISGYCIKYIEFDWNLSIHKSKKHNQSKTKRTNLIITNTA